MSILLPLKTSPGIPEPLWLPAPETPNLPVNELHIWRARLDSREENRHENAPRLFDSDAPSCPVDRDRTEKIKAALFRKAILERYICPEHGSGVVAGPASRLKVAVAQCDGLALIAISRDVRVIGLDVERVREDIPIEEMAGGFLDAHSQWDLRVTWSLQEKAWKFFQFWTSNEACEQARPYSQSAHACQVRGFSPERDFIAALAIQGGPEAGLVYWDWNGRGTGNEVGD
jgi:hypothetical protein